MIVHIVLFEFDPHLHVSVVDDVCKRMLALKDICIHPETKEPYIVHAVGGRDNSEEGHQVGGFSHAFVSHFQNHADRKYYLEEDPSHLAFVNSLKGVVINVRVVDFVPGIF